MQHLSNKSKINLFETVHDKIMDARIKIGKLNIENEFIKKQIDNIMFELNCSAPQSAISCFKYDKDR